MKMEQSWDYTRNHDSREFNEFYGLECELRNALDQELESLFGISAVQLKASVFGWPEMDYDYQFLSLEKKGRVREINLRYDFLIAEARQGSPFWESDPAVEKTIREINRQKKSELARFLTPQELEALLLRESPAARYVRENLPEAKTEEEFRQMVQAVEQSEIGTPELKSFADRYGLNRQSGPGDEDKHQAQLQARLKELLGEERLTEQQQQEIARQAEEEKQKAKLREQESRTEFESLALSVGISAEDAERLYERMKELGPELDAKFEQMEKSLSGTPEEKNQQRRAAVKSEMEKLAIEIVGEKGRELVKKIEERDE